MGDPMNTKSYLILISALFMTMNANASWNEKIFKTKDGSVIQRDRFINDLKSKNIIVIGEKHYTLEVQREEGNVISNVVLASKKENSFSLSWEFLNASSQTETEELFNRVVSYEISTHDFLVKTQGLEKASLYSPIIDATATLGGKLYGVNLSREEKAPVVKDGLSALDPKLMPPDFKMGGANYLERFTQTMQGHATPDQITKYFAAQSLVDDVSAYHLTNDSSVDLKFLVIGAFHSQYNDGVVQRIKDRNPQESVVNVEIIDASDYKEDELSSIFTDPKYGPRADYIIFVNEPQP